MFGVHSTLHIAYIWMHASQIRARTADNAHSTGKRRVPSPPPMQFYTLLPEQSVHDMAKFCLDKSSIYTFSQLRTTN